MNTNSDDFEKRLERQRLKEIPGEWRDKILSAARQTAPSGCATRNTQHATRAILSALNSRLSALLWPHPGAWASLAAVWMLVLGLNFTTRDETPQLARQAAPPSPQMRELLQQQERLFAELIGPVEIPEADRPKPFTPRPRSQRREESLNA